MNFWMEENSMETKWYSVKEKLPKYGTNVLAYSPKIGFVYDDIRVLNVYNAPYLDKGISIGHHDFEDKCVTHWAYLPPFPPAENP